MCPPFVVDMDAVEGNDKVCGITAFLTTAYAILPQMSRSYVVFGKVRTIPFTTYIFVQLLHQSVQFGVALLRLGNLFPAVLDRFLLAQTGRLPDTLNKLLLVVADIPAYPLNGGEDRRLQLLRGNIVNGAVLHRRPVSGTGKNIVNVLALNKTVVVGQLRAAVGAVE